MQRIEAIMQRWESELQAELPRPVVLEGDVTATGLGLGAQQKEWLSQHCESVLHNAAVVSFEGEDRTQEPWLSNLEGTRHVVALFQELDLHEFHYVSTAYVCGRREGQIKEEELACGQEFRNAYESSKFEAERLVREKLPQAITTIYRPTIIAGDSQSGYTSSYHGLMWYLRLFDILVPQQPKDAEGKYHTPVNLPMEGNEPQNVVTVDFVSKAISGLVCNRLAHGRTYHLATKTPTTYRQIIDFCCEFFNSGGVSYKSQCDAETSQFATAIFEQSRIYHDYAVCEVIFDMTQLEQFLPDLVAPEIDREMIFRFMNFGRHDRWGKRKESPPKSAPQGLPLLLSHLAEMIRGGQVEDSTIINADIWGPGGGQWSISINPEGAFAVEEGLSCHAAKMIRTRVQDLKKLYAIAMTP